MTTDRMSLLLPPLLSDCGMAPLSDAALMAFQSYYELLLEWNSRINLTAITAASEVAEKHFLDSLLLAPFVEKHTNGRVIDIGTGAGFPGLPLAIAMPTMDLTLVDALRKRCDFLQLVQNRLQLFRVQVYHDRAETFAASAEHREAYDVCVARAVARLPMLVEYCLPVLRLGGFLYAAKGPDADDEAEESARALQELGGAIVNRTAYTLPCGDARVVLTIEKQHETPQKYPRRPGMAKKKPLL